MESLNAFLIIAMLTFGFLFVIWERTNWFNLFLKLLFLSVFAWSVFLLLTYNGYLVKRNQPATPIGRNI